MKSYMKVRYSFDSSLLRSMFSKNLKDAPEEIEEANLNSELGLLFPFVSSFVVAHEIDCKKREWTLWRSQNLSQVWD